MQVLVSLSKANGQVVSKQQLIDEVWKGTFVTDDVLTRSVSELRDAFGDEARESQVIQTIPKRGYRLLLPTMPATEAVKLARGRRVRKVVWASFAFVLLVFATLLALYVKARGRGGNATRPQIESLAVLPLKNLSSDPEQQYFVDGLTDELTGDLARLGKLRVISRNSAMLYTDTHKPLPQIAKELSVDAVVTGTVQRSNGRVRIRANLVRAATGEILWAQSFDRDLSDVLGLEVEVSQAIADEVGLKFTPQVQHRLERKSTTNPEARDAYLRARYFLDKNDKEGALKCVQYLQQAIAKDPNYAAAYALLVPCYDIAGFLGVIHADEEASKIKAAVMKAVELDDELAEAHNVLADHYLEDLWDFGSAEREYKRALELDPNSAEVHHGYSDYLRLTG